MCKHQTSKSGSLIIFTIIFLSGFTFLIYEVSWNRMLSLVLGATVSASTIVLATFMAGFSLGAYFFGKIVNKSLKPGRLLAILLIGIGGVGIINFYLLKTFLPLLYQVFGDKDFSILGTELIVFSISIIMLLCQTFLMGGMLPIVSKIIIRSKESISTGIGKIYALDTLGSAIGGLISGFVLLGNLGQQNTVLLAVGINLLIGIYLFLTKSNLYTDIREDSAETNETQTKSKSKFKEVNETLINRKIALPSTFIFGFSIMALQVTWMRIYKIYLTNTSYTFALISSLVIIGFFFGSWLFSKYSGKIKNYGIVMFHSILLLGVLTFIGLIILINLPEIIMFPFESLLGSPFIKLIIMPMLAALVVVFPPTVISGFAFPLACRMLTNNVNKVGKGVGTALTLNSLGSAIGPILTGFVLIPLLGAGVSVILILCIEFGLSVFLVFQLKSFQKARIYKPILISIFVLFLVIVVYKPQIRILPPSFSKVDKEILFYEETVEATLAVSKERNNKSEVKTAYVNNAVVIGSTYDAIKAVKMIGHVPFFIGLECKEVLIVGFGIGVTTSTIASHPEVKSIDCVELAPGLKDAAKYFRDINANIINDPRLNFIAGDGRHFLQRTNNKYDLISSDPTHPILGSANLYSKEYFELCKSHLTEKGMVSQYLPLHKLRPEDFLGIIKTFQSVFTEATVWLGHTHAILVGSMQPIQIDFNQWEQNIAAIGSDPVFYSNPYHLAACLLLDKKQIMDMDTELRINTDDLSYLEFFNPSCFDTKNLNKNISFLSENRADLHQTFSNINQPERMSRFVSGSQYFIKSSIYFQERQLQKSLDELRKAVRANPENEEYPFLIKFYFGVPR